MSTRKIATIVGLMLIVATVVNVAGSRIISSVLSNSNWLDTIFTNTNPIKIGVVMLLISALASVSIAVWLYPILRKYNPYLALTAVVFRTIEAVFYIVAAVVTLPLIDLGRKYLEAGSPDNSYFQTIGSYILTLKDGSGFIFAVIPFALGGLAYYFVFYQSKLVPRWLSVWGILACFTLLAASSVALFGGPPFTIAGSMMVLAAPIALQEMVLAVWLIVKGFNKKHLK